MNLAPDTSTSAEATVGAASVQFSTTLATSLRYLYVANVATWIAQGAVPTASAGAGSMYVPANTIVIIDGACGAKLAVIEDSTAGKASLTQARRL